VPNNPKRNKPKELTKGGSSRKVDPTPDGVSNKSIRNSLLGRNRAPHEYVESFQKLNAKGAVMRAKTAATSRRAAENVPPSGKGKTTVGTKSSSKTKKR